MTSPQFLTPLLFHKLPHLHPVSPDNLQHVNSALQSADINGGGWFVDNLLQELLTAGVVNGKGAFGRGFYGDGGGCRIGV
jgi:hypothetical protein